MKGSKSIVLQLVSTELMILDEMLPIIDREWLNDLLARVVATSGVFSSRPNELKKVLEFLLSKDIDGGNRASIINTFISSKFLLSRSLS